MNSESRKFLYKLLATPSPTGFEQPIQRVVRERMKGWAAEIETDVHGNLAVGLNTKAQRKVMLAGHCDQIGFMVRHITEEGYLYLSPLGGPDPVVLPGTHVSVHAKDGPLEGVIGRKPVHKQKPDERGQGKVNVDDVWIDIGARNRKEAVKLVEIGDPVTFRLGVTELRNDLVCSPGLDDKAGLFVVMEALRLCANARLDVALYAVSTVQEEVGLRGAITSAFGIAPDVGVAVDVTFATDNPGNDDKKEAPCVLGKGPTIARGPNTNPIVGKRLIEAAKKARLPYQLAPSSRIAGNDAAAIQISRSGVAASAIGIPNRYMHTQVEVCSLKDLENAARLLAAFVKDIGARTSFKPL